MSKLMFAALGSALLLSSCTMMQSSSALKFDDTKYTAGSVTVDGKTYKYRAYNVVYVTNPVDTKYQSMNIYVPEEYFDGQGSGKYTAQTAPIFLPNQVGGYLPAEPGNMTNSGMGGGPAPTGGTALHHRRPQLPPEQLYRAAPPRPPPPPCRWRCHAGMWWPHPARGAAR